MDSDKLKQQAKRWAEKQGLREAQNALIIEGLSYSLAYQITTGKYPSEIKQRVSEALQRAMKKSA